MPICFPHHHQYGLDINDSLFHRIHLPKLAYWSNFLNYSVNNQGFMVHGMQLYPKIDLIFCFTTPCQSAKKDKKLTKQSVCYSDALFYCHLQCSLKTIELFMGRGLRTINSHSEILSFEYFNVYYAVIYRSSFIHLPVYEISTYIMLKNWLTY